MDAPRPVIRLAELPAALAMLPGAGGAAAGTVLLALLLIGAPCQLLALVMAWLGAVATAWLGGRAPSRPALLNVALAGLALGALVPPGVTLLAAGLLCGALVLLLAEALERLLAQARLPLLTLPAVLAVIVLHMMVAPRATLAVDDSWLAGAWPLGTWLADGVAALPAPLAGFLAACGVVVAMPHAAAGAVVLALVAWRSPLLALLALGGFAAGAAVRILGGLPAAQAWAAGDGGNPLLAALWVGGLLLLPTWRSVLLALLAAAGCALLGDALGATWTTLTTLPFVLASWVALAGRPAEERAPDSTALADQPPEELLAEHLSTRARFPGSARTLAPPVDGTWLAWAAPGCAPHTLALVVGDDEGRAHAGDGARLRDHHAWRQAVRAPVAGQVVAVVDGVADHMPDAPPSAGPDHGGNLVLLRDPRGFHVRLAHLAQRSVQVQAGQWVERGALLGRCGSSGGPAAPHLHIQVSDSAAPDAPALPFSLLSWWDGSRLRANDLPRPGESIEALAPGPVHPAAPGAVLGLTPGEHLVLTERDDAPVVPRVWRVRLETDGTTTVASGDGRLVLGHRDGELVVLRCTGGDPWLRLMATALPRLPHLPHLLMAQREGLAWTDQLPATSAIGGWRGRLAALLAVVRPACAVVRTHHRRSGMRIDSTVLPGVLWPGVRSTVELDPHGRLLVVRGPRIGLRRPDPRILAGQVLPERAA